ncbi:DUF1616 domain-containing protein [Halococcus agarilyticus]|uniref:DUF1616 domain-containing protein n=1 Tax=Halococcus agarilyticus TaxID=1232219 RepID=UPI000677E509|nr:DUF1616 domain-containing protein [Halococcus agarilyticus]
MADGTLRLMLPRFLRRFPADLAVTVLLVVATAIAALAPVISETPLRIALGLAFVLFAPGYAFVAALFPERGPTGDEAGSESAASHDSNAGMAGRADPRREGSIDGIERVALSFGLSIALTPLIGLVLNFTPFGIRLVPIVLSIGGFTLVACAVAAVRRRELPAEDRFRVPYRAWMRTTRVELFEPDTRMDAVLNVVLVVSLLLAISSVGYAALVPRTGESFSEFYLLTENESGALVADDYPRNFTVGQSQPVIVGIGNHEHERVEYSVVAELQRVSIRNNSTTVRERQELDRFSRTVPANESVDWTHNVTPTMTGERLRLIYLLYRGSPPSEPTAENAYRETHLWVNVSSQ